MERNRSLRIKFTSEQKDKQQEMGGVNDVCVKGRSLENLTKSTLSNQFMNTFKHREDDLQISWYTFSQNTRGRSSNKSMHSFRKWKVEGRKRASLPIQRRHFSAPSVYRLCSCTLPPVCPFLPSSFNLSRGRQKPLWFHHLWSILRVGEAVHSDWKTGRNLRSRLGKLPKALKHHFWFLKKLEVILLSCTAPLAYRRLEALTLPWRVGSLLGIMSWR